MRHAYLIIAHNNPKILYAQVKILKDIDTDFYYHLDRRFDFDKNKLIELAGDSRCIFLPSKKVQWGKYSQIDCELRLLESAIQGDYDYYHLISGVDMPIKTKIEIDNFFQKNNGKEFIHFDKKKVAQQVTDRIALYHFCPGRKNYERKLNGFFYKIQKLLKVNRLAGLEWEVQKGANWFSITRDLANYVVQNKKLIKKRFACSFCGDEVFLQTLVWNSEFKNNLYDQTFADDYHSCMRYIDWERGNPYVFTKEDLQELIEVDYLFARKFSSDAKNGEIVELLIDRLAKESYDI